MFKFSRLILSCLMLSFTSAGAYAETSPAAAAPIAPAAAKPDARTAGSHGSKAAQTRQEAITNAKKRVQKLEAMSDAEWETKRKARMERREARRTKMKDRMEQHAPAASGTQTLPATTGRQ